MVSMKVDTGEISPNVKLASFIVFIARASLRRLTHFWINPKDFQQIRHSMPRGTVAAALTLLLALAPDPSTGARAPIRREDAFVGYSERTIPASGSHYGERRPEDGASGRPTTLVLSTSAGEIEIGLRRDWAPELTKAIETAVGVGGACSSSTSSSCSFYRSEAAPDPGAIDNYGGPGPPYALLQGSFEGLGSDHAKEEGPEALRGYVCLIGNGPDFFIATRSHREWGKAHTVFGEVVSMKLVDDITETYPVHHETWGQTNVTVLDDRIPFTARIVS